MNNLNRPDWGDSDMQDLQHEEMHRMKHVRALFQHPDCIDPDHPGCERCEDDEEN